MVAVEFYFRNFEKEGVYRIAGISIICIKVGIKDMGSVWLTHPNSFYFPPNFHDLAYYSSFVKMRKLSLKQTEEAIRHIRGRNGFALRSDFFSN